MLSNNATVSNTTAGFHTYGMDWEPDFITWYFDGQPVYQIATPADMNQPMYMIVNLAVGGIFAGAPDYVSSGQMQVDYVRAYQADSPGGSANTAYDGSTDTISTNGNYALPDNVHNLILTGSGQTVWGNGLDNVITSNNDNNVIDGGDGNDVVIAGRGHDYLTGGAGYDTFVYNGFPWDIGQITDFTPYQDQVDLRGMFAGVGYGGSNPIGDGYLSFKQDGNGTEVWFDPDGWGSGGAYYVFELDGVQASSIQVADDFIVGAGAGPNPAYGAGQPAAPSAPPPVAAPLDVSTAVSPGGSGQTFTSDNAGDWWAGTGGDDVFNLGRGGDGVAGNGGADTFRLADVPWARAEITDFAPGDLIDLSGLFQRYAYAAADPVADGRLVLAPDGAGGTQIWFDADNLPGAAGTWQLLTLDQVNPATLHDNGAFISG
jgi:Ca2+-binding RTX toxin-like protein